MKNIVLNTDSYKVSMYLQYPPNTQTVYSYIESRGGDYSKIVYFGLQAFIKKYLTVPVTNEMVDEGKAMWEAHGMPFNESGWRYIVDQHNGKLPLKIRTIPEGTRVAPGVPLLTIENTDPECFWLTTWIETALLRAIWYPTTVATVSNSIRRFIQSALILTGDPEGLPFKLHDFGPRGASSEESAAIGGAAHLLSFAGTDNMSAIMHIKEFYDDPMAGFSIPAAEHSTITSWGRYNEADAYENMIDQFREFPLYAVVSDSYDIYNAVKNVWGEKLREKVIKNGNMLVVRPDSGDPLTVISKIIEILGEKFGYDVNEKGYKVLKNVRIIQGDGVNPESIREIVNYLIDNKWSIDNIAFGMGGALLQKLDRDTLKFALKCSAIEINGAWFDVKKDPITDSGKASKGGRVTAVEKNGEIVSGLIDSPDDIMYTVYKNGDLVVEDFFEEMKTRANA